MGCGESKEVQRISVSAANRKLEESVKNLDVVRISSASSETSELGLSEGSPSSSTPNTPQDNDLSSPSSSSSGLGSTPQISTKENILENIPVSDLGVSSSFIFYI